MTVAVASRTSTPPTVQQFARARAGRQFDELFRLGRALVERTPLNAAIHRAMARTLNELGRDEEAQISWRALRECDSEDIESAFQVGRYALAGGANAEEAAQLDPPLSRGAATRRVAQALAEPAWPSVADEDLHHVAICGVSFCGSTLLDRILGGLPGVSSIGESHWLTKEFDGANYVLMDLGKPPSGRGPFCTVCGKDCKYLNLPFRYGLAIDPSKWYQKIAHRLRTRTLVSADKNLPKLVDNDPLLRFTSLVVFKSPLQAWASHLSKMPIGNDPAFYRAGLEKYAYTWTSAYRGLLDDLRPKGEKVVMNFDEFAERPAAGLKALTDRLGLKHDPKVLTETRPGHAIGGNSAAMRSLRASDYKVEVRKLPPVDIPDEHVRWLNELKLVQDVYSTLWANRLEF